MTCLLSFHKARRFFTYLSVLLHLISCKSRNYQEISQVKSDNQVDVLLAHCLAPQGNGGNWASLLGWISEEINLRVSEGKKLESEGKSVGIFLGCYSGAAQEVLAELY